MDHAWHPNCPPPIALVSPTRRGRVDRAGPTPGVVRGRGWFRVARGWYVPTGTPRTPEQRAYEVAARLPAGAMVTGWAALRLAGANYFEGLEADHLTPSAVPILLPHQSRMGGEEVAVVRTRRALPVPVMRYGVPCAPTVPALLDQLGRARNDRHAGVMVDMALAARIVLPKDLHALAGGRRLSARARYAVERACGECRSPRESEMLQIWESVAGFPRPLMNREVRDLSGRLLAIVDLLDVEAGVCGEFNGAAHRTAARQSRDERRQADLRAVGLETFTVVGSDSEAVQVARMRAARERASWAQPADRRWRCGDFVSAPPLVELDEHEREREAIMLAHYAEWDARAGGERAGGERSGPRFA